MDNIGLDDLLIQDMVLENQEKESFEQTEAESAFIASEKAKHKSCRIVSASAKYLWLGLLFLGFAIVMEILAWGVVNDVGVALILQLPVALCFLLSSSIIDWFNREEFTLYFAKVEDNISLKFIKDNFEIVDINDYAILFVDMDKTHLYNSWKLYNSESIYKIEVDYFLN